jgi:phosphatidylglycerol:prolipoprotein diacylglycerol transferase
MVIQVIFMMPYPHIRPEIFRIGPIAVRWYGVMYLLGFAASYVLVAKQINKRGLVLGRDFLENLYTFVVLGLIIGARLGYVIFYNPGYYVHHPLNIVALWEGGMSFHGGLIGSVIAGIWRCKRDEKDPWQIADLVTATAPIGLGLGRLGNFINGELYGRVSEVPWAMVFPAGGPFPRHPSELYEFFFEGVVLFAILWIVKDGMRRAGALTSLFLLLYGVFRFFVEFFREPDPQLGYVLGPFTMGQVLSASMALAGAVLLIIRLTGVKTSGASR